eukprot:386826_1
MYVLSIFMCRVFVHPILYLFPGIENRPALIHTQLYHLVRCRLSLNNNLYYDMHSAFWIYTNRYTSFHLFKLSAVVSDSVEGTVIGIGIGKIDCDFIALQIGLAVINWIRSIADRFDLTWVVRRFAVPLTNFTD